MPDVPARRRWPAVLAGLGVALLLGECGARWRYAHPPLPPAEYAPAPPGMYQNDPSVGFRLAPGFRNTDERFGTNAMGFRDKLRSTGAPAEGVVRIAVIGDSFTAGVGVADDEQFTRRLEEGLLATGARVEVWNLGVPHFGTQQAMLQLLERWDDIDPAIVVHAVFDANDPWDDVQGPSFHTVRKEMITRRGWAPWPDDPFNGLRSELNRPLLAHHVPGDRLLHRFSSLYRLLLRGAHAAQYGRVQRWPWGMEPFDYEAFGGVGWLYLAPPPPPIAGGWTITEEVLLSLRDAVAERGAQYTVLAIPSKILIEREDLRLAFEEGWENGYREGGGSWDGAYEFDVELPTRRLAEITDALRIPRIDVTEALTEANDQERVYYRDDSHWNAAGHRVAAIELGEGLGRLGWLEVPQGLRAAITEAVPVGSAPEDFLEDFRSGRPGPGPRGPGGGGGKGADSEIPVRLVDPGRLAALLPAGPDGWTASEPTVEVGPLPAPREDVFVASARRVYTDSDGVQVVLTAYDGGGQPEIDTWWRTLGDDVVLGAVPSGALPTTARIGVVAPEARAWVDGALVDALEVELRSAGSPTRWPTLTIGEGPDPDLRARLVDPAALLDALPTLPGWQQLDAMPMYRPHGAHATGRDVPWTAQVKGWYRGPEGSFALVIQDTGEQEALIGSRRERTVRAFGRGESVDEHGVTLAGFDVDGIRGFRTCMPSQGLCKVVVPLGEDDARFNVILMGPPPAGDGAFAALIAAIDRAALPEPPSGRALDDVADTARPIPFGQALVDLTEAETLLLYPNLVAFGAPATELATLLPKRIGALRRDDVLLGVQEDELSAWVGAMGTYYGPGAKVTVLIQDTAWEPTQVNRYRAAWARSDRALSDGRPVASVGSEEQLGVVLAAPLDVENPRLVFAVHGGEGVESGVLLKVLEALPVEVGRRVQEGSGRSGAYVRSELLPPEAALAGLSDPEALAASLPKAPGGWRILAEGHGYRREAKQTLVATATRVLGSADGVIEATIQDLGPADAPVTVERGRGTSSAESMRGELSKGGGARCDAELCKWATLVDDRYVLSLSGPASYGKAALGDLGATFALSGLELH